MELNKSSESLKSLDSPLETPKIKPDSPISKRIDEKIEDVEEEDVFEQNNKGEEFGGLLNHNGHRKKVSRNTRL